VTTFLTVQFNSKTKHAAKYFAFPVIAFLAVAFFITFNIISLPNLVIGDNFNWTPSNTLDILGPKVIRETYLGDIAVLSTFKSGFLFPITYLLTTLNLPSTIVYPFLFYTLTMVSFYFFSKEFLNNEGLRILAAILYLINPITPYYYSSIINAFSLVLLPLGLKFFIRSLRELRSHKKPGVVKNFGFTALFLSLTVSANEQIVLSIGLVTLFFALTFIIVSFKKYRITKNFFKFCLLNFLVFGLVFLFVTLPLIISLSNIQSAPLATYFQGSSSSIFLQNVQYTYINANLNTLVRLGGDSGAGLGTNSWYDSNTITNYFGYVLFGFFILSILGLVLSKKKSDGDRIFFYQSIFLFVTVLALILLMKNLSGLINNESLGLVLKTWETPGKLRAVLLISILTLILALFRTMELSAGKGKKKLIVGLMLTFLIVSTVVYNSPWLINYAGQTTLQEVSDSLKWGGLYNQTYVNVANKLEKESSGSRGIILPFTHKAELYSSPNTRVFQMVSDLNGQASLLFSGGNVSWSKGLGLFSIKSLAVMNSLNSNEILIFPNQVIYALNDIHEQIKNDSGLKLVDESQDYSLYDNTNSLPMLYASNNYIIYDNVGTLKYAFPFVNSSELPVFLNQEDTIGQLNVPSSINQGKYELHAVGIQNDETKNLTFNINNVDTIRAVQLSKENSNYPNDFSTTCTLSPGDTVKAPDAEIAKTTQLTDETLNSTSFSIGSYGSFDLDFTVNILKNGNHSFLGPRVLIDTGSETYFFIMHDDGILELAVEKDGVFHSSIISQYVGYTLRDPKSSVNVKITRLVDEVNIYVNGNLYMTFPIAPQMASVSLVSEQSISTFSKINITTSNSLRLFAIRQDFTNIPFTVEKDSPEESSLIVSSNGTDFAVESQYLYNNLKNVQNNLSCSSLRVNVFFKGWIFNSTQALSEQKISIGTTGQELSYSLTIISIGFTYSALLFMFKPSVVKKTKSLVCAILFNRLKSELKKGKSQ
jgi:hypothetical protein